MTEARSVVLWSHLPYYAHAAAALHGAGLLKRYLAAPFVTGEGGPRWARDAAGAWGALGRTRRFPELAGAPTRRLWVAQSVALAAQRAAMARGEGSALRLRSGLWDAAASLHIDRPGVLHSVVGVGLWSGARARRRGALLVADVRAPHPYVLESSVNRLLIGRGMVYESPDRCIVDRMVRELEAADVLVCNSELTRRSFLDQGFDPRRVLTVPLGCDPGRFTPRADAAVVLPGRHPFTVLFVGREPVRKGLPDLVDAARRLPRWCRLVIAGDVDPASRRALGELSIDVEVLGNVGAADMPECYRRSSVLALPSLSEAFGMVVLEAMAAGLPVVVSDAVGAAEVLDDGVNGYVVPAGSVDDLGDRLVRLAGDADLVARLGAAARATALGQTWDAYGARLVDAYRASILPLVN